MTLAGTAGADSQFTYAASAAHSDRSGTSGSVNAGYRSGFGVVNAQLRPRRWLLAGIDRRRRRRRRAPAAASPWASRPATPWRSSSAPNAKGARVVNAPGVKVNRFGYALVPYLQPYHLNSIELDPKGLSLDVELQPPASASRPALAAWRW